MSLPSASALVESTQTHIVEIKHQRRQPRRLVRRIYPRIAPSYIAYDYPYYYARGFYPTHIGPGYFYDGYPYLHGRRFYSRHRAR